MSGPCESQAASMDWKQIRLANGLRLLSVQRPHTPTVAVEVVVKAGSRYDREASGGAHLLEHLVFKGTCSRSAREIYTAIETVGGSIEGQTAKEYAHLYAHLPRQHFEIGVEMLADVLTSPRLAPEDFWSEKLVVLEEIHRMRDNTNFIYNLFAQALWPGDPLGYPIWGDASNFAHLEYEELLAFHARAYVAANTVVVVCGDVPHDAVAEVVGRRLATMPAGQELSPPAAAPAAAGAPRVARALHLEKDLYQTHLLLGFPTVGIRHADQSALLVIERVLGMGGSARLFQRLREEEKLVYNALIAMATYMDAGYLAVYATCLPENAPRVQELILQEFDRLAQSGVTREELARAKSNYAGTLARRFETNAAQANVLGVQAVLHKAESVAESVARIERVTQDDVGRVARTYFTPERYLAATVGRDTSSGRKRC